MSLKKEVVEKLSAILGAENIVSSDDSIRAADPLMVRTFEKAHGYGQEHKPLCIARVHHTRQVSDVLKYCNVNDIHVIPRTGGSSSEDQLLIVDDRTIYLDGDPMNQIIEMDPVNMTATVQCGVHMDVLEARANAMGLTTGHAPQSIPLASIGGLVATRSTGQFSTYYGGIEELVCGLEGVLPSGEVFRIRPVPRRAAGPDLRHLVIGSEGSIAFLTEVTVKLFAYYPDTMWKGGYIVNNFQTGIDAIREIMGKGYRPSVVRLYDKPDVDHNYGSVKLKDEEAFLFFSVEGPGDIPAVHGEAIHAVAMGHGAEYIGTKAVDHWFATRNNVCKTIGTEVEFERFRQTGVFNSTIEICANWSDIRNVYDDMTQALPQRLPNLTMLGGHVSHCYMNGTNIYFVYAIRIDDPKQAHKEQRKVYDAICDVILNYSSGTIVHHHGIGKIRVGRIREELGSSYALLRSLKDTFDPNGIMNPGCLLPLA